MYQTECDKKEASKIINELKEANFKLHFIEGVAFISCKNPKFQPNDGSNPFLATTIECLIGQIEPE